LAELSFLAYLPHDQKTAPIQAYVYVIAFLFFVAGRARWGQYFFNKGVHLFTGHFADLFPDIDFRNINCEAGEGANVPKKQLPRAKSNRQLITIMLAILKGEEANLMNHLDGLKVNDRIESLLHRLASLRKHTNFIIPREVIEAFKEDFEFLKTQLAARHLDSFQQILSLRER